MLHRDDALSLERGFCKGRGRFRRSCPAEGMLLGCGCLWPSSSAFCLHRDQAVLEEPVSGTPLLEGCSESLSYENTAQSEAVEFSKAAELGGLLVPELAQDSLFIQVQRNKRSPDPSLPPGTASPSPVHLYHHLRLIFSPPPPLHAPV